VLDSTWLRAGTTACGGPGGQRRLGDRGILCRAGRVARVRDLAAGGDKQPDPPVGGKLAKSSPVRSGSPVRDPADPGEAVVFPGVTEAHHRGRNIWRNFPMSALSAPVPVTAASATQAFRLVRTMRSGLPGVRHGTVSDRSNSAVVDGGPGSQTGSQRPQASDHAEPLSATVCAGKRLIGRHPATPGDWVEVPPKQ
jgi:hypothetical protein